MAGLRRIDGRIFDDTRQPLPPLAAGAKPQLRWIAIDLLRVDPAYQRDIGGRAAANIRKIAREFDWAMFGTVLVAEDSQQGIFLIFDGQCRTTAAHLRGFKDVPCQIAKINRARQAAAFAAVNANVTALTPMHLYHAHVAAGEEQACALAAVLADADVTVCRYPVPTNLMKAGDTLAAGKLPNMLRRYGPDVLRTALRTITRTRKGNPGCVRAPIVDALCVTLDSEPAWRADEARLLKVMHTFDFYAAYELARRANIDGQGSVAAAFIEIVTEHLEKKLGERRRVTDEPAASAATKKNRIEADLMISTLQSEADRARIWADAVSDGNRGGLQHRADVLERAADVVSWVRNNEAEFREWQRTKRRRTS